MDVEVGKADDRLAAAMTPTAGPHLEATFFLDHDHASVRDFTQHVIAGASSPRERASLLFAAVRDQIWYDPYSVSRDPAHYRASYVLEAGRAYCVPKAVLLAAGLFTVLLAENCRVPFDDPNTHLELTMIHEVMVLDHSGPPLAVILHGASVKLLFFAVLLTEAVLPVGGLNSLAAAAVLSAGVLAVTVGVGLVESLLARFAFKRVPLLLTTAFLLCLFALLMAWKGGAA